MKKFLGLIVAALMLTACTAGGLLKGENESDVDYKARVHAANVADVQVSYEFLDLAMQIARKKGFGDEEFWAYYDEADAAFDAAFKAWAASDGDLALRNIVTISMEALREYVKDMEEAEGKELVYVSGYVAWRDAN